MESGHEQRNIAKGTLAYIEPIFAEKIKEFETREEAAKYLTKHKEISNEIYFIGNLTKDPKMIKTASGVILTQYQIGANRKFKVSTDVPENRADFPWVKTYGENAEQDKKHLHIGSCVFIDGIIQARKVYRTTKCPHCGEFYKWEDKTMEIVPYETEYLKNCYTDEDIAKIENENLQNRLASIYGEYDSVSEEEMPIED